MPNVLIKPEIKEILDNLKLVTEETYNSVVERLIKNGRRYNRRKGE